MHKLLNDDIASLLQQVFTLTTASGTAETLPVQCSTMLSLLRACQALRLLPSPQVDRITLDAPVFSLLRSFMYAFRLSIQ